MWLLPSPPLPCPLQGTLLALQQLRTQPGTTPEVHVDGLVGTTAGGFSGGTIASLLGALDDPASAGMRGAHALDTAWPPRPDHCPQMGPHYTSSAKRWSMASVMAAVNEKVVHRSAALSSDKAGNVYGSRETFSYREATLAPNAVGAFIGTTVLGLGAALLAFHPSRWALSRTLLPAPGEGPSERARESGCFSGHFVASDASVPPKRAYARVAAQSADPGYKGTSIMAAEAALCLALQRDACPGKGGGVLTPATCMGGVLVDRLRSAGFTLEARAFAEDERVPDA
jgi:short subunit dehydrogenase-like uncharacterized protein